MEGQALLCMLAYYVEWHMQVKVAPLLFAEQDPVPAIEERSSRAKQGKVNGRPMYSFRLLLDNLSTLTCNRIEVQVGKVPPFKMLTRPTELQRRAIKLLGVKLG